MVKIKTTHVGSLPRSNELSDLLFKKDQKQKINLDVFDQIDTYIDLFFNNLIHVSVNYLIKYI